MDLNGGVFKDETDLIFYEPYSSLLCKWDNFFLSVTDLNTVILAQTLCVLFLSCSIFGLYYFSAVFFY